LPTLFALIHIFETHILLDNYHLISMLTYTKAKAKPSNEVAQNMQTYTGEGIRKSVNPPNPVAKVPFY
jgi:hypothetical protein